MSAIGFVPSAGAGARIATGSYVGTGTFGSSSPNILNLGFTPKLIMIAPDYVDSVQSVPILIWISGMTKTFSETDYSNVITILSSESTFSWYSTADSTQLNRTGKVYHYIAIG